MKIEVHEDGNEPSLLENSMSDNVLGNMTQCGLHLFWRVTNTIPRSMVFFYAYWGPLEILSRVIWFFSLGRSKTNSLD